MPQLTSQLLRIRYDQLVVKGNHSAEFLGKYHRKLEELEANTANEMVYDQKMSELQVIAEEEIKRLEKIKKKHRDNSEDLNSLLNDVSSIILIITRYEVS